MVDLFLAFAYFALQIVLIFGIVFLFGFLSRSINAKFYSNMGSAGKYICYITGALAVPIHEASHALFGILFMHKIKEFQPFKIDDETKSLGYTIHGYRKDSLYQNIGNFFIGIAPMLVMSFLILVLSIFLAPELLNASLDAFSVLMKSDDISEIWNSLELVGRIFIRSFVDWKFYVFILLSMVLALHMTLSKADLRGSASGVLFLLFVLVAVNVAIYLTDGVGGSKRFTASVARFVFPIFLMISIAMLFLLAALGISSILKRPLRKL